MGCVTDVQNGGFSGCWGGMDDPSGGWTFPRKDGRSLRILIADTYYGAFLDDYARRHPDVARRGYAEQHAHLMAQHFGTGDAPAAGLRALGCEARTVVLNAASLQHAWALEHGFEPDEGVEPGSAQTSGAGRGRSASAMSIPSANSNRSATANPSATVHPSVALDPSASPARKPRWSPSIFLEQVRQFRPDVVYVQELSIARDEVWRRVKEHTRLLVGQIACSLPATRTFEHHDLILSSWPPIVSHFRSLERAAEYVPLAFDDAVLPALGEVQRRDDVVFVGGLSPVHEERMRLLEALCRAVPMRVFGYGAETLPADSAIRACHGGERWGMEMYRELAAAKVAVNCHGVIEVAGHGLLRYANNCRLFEATGVGTALVTDHKENLGELFEPGVEVATYRSAEECVEVIAGLLRCEDRRTSIASAGRKRTLSEHAYGRRMRDVLALLEGALCGGSVKTAMLDRAGASRGEAVAGLAGSALEDRGSAQERGGWTGVR